MNTTAIILIVAAVIVITGLAFWAFRRQRASQLKARFGPEYNHAVRQYGDESHAQEALEARTRRMEKIHIRALARDELDSFQERWETVQRSFVDDPAGSIERADALVNEVMRQRGYPMADFEHRAEDISVDHPHVVQNYRIAHAVALRHERGDATTEDFRQALVHYHDLFDELLQGQYHQEGRLKR